jgi:hypothetical protein
MTNATAVDTNTTAAPEEEGEGNEEGENPNEFENCVVPPGRDPGDVGSFILGAIGGTIGMGAGVTVGASISALLVGLGVIAGPIGWLAIGLGFLAAFAVGAWFGHRGGQVGEAIYDAAQ